MLMVGSVAACSTGAPSDSSTGAAGGTDGGELSVAFIQGVIGDNFYISMECGVRAAAEELGVDVSVQGPQKWDPALQQPILSSVSANQPDAILIAPNDVQAMEGPGDLPLKASWRFAAVMEISKIAQ
ncbi:substrate-binding domain-containing protein [Georgenia sp. SUBG003]|uniref:substrate-binding domain-containing protein n=1 Tax=Georgenia sp. SUBG003 TaxID=1497974 RepID=UPI003AB83969